MTKDSHILTPSIEDIRNFLHLHPELSFEEYKSSAYIESIVRKYPCKVTTFEDSTGLVVEIGSGHPVVALRADMDALWQEVDGKFQANHSCGHDAHMTIGLGVFLKLIEADLPSKGTFKFIFQPGEEKGTGALSLIEKGVIDDVDFLYGMHLRPIEELRNGQFAPAIEHGAAKFIEGSILGEDAHGARPHLNVNAIQVGMELFEHMNHIQINPNIPHSAKLTSFQAGGKSPNIIPGNATFSIDLRAQNNDVLNQLSKKIEAIALMLENYHHIKIPLEVGAHVAAAQTNAEAIAYMENAISQQMGNQQLIPPITTTGGDDFHFYTIKRPELKATMLAIGCDLQPGLHHPYMTYNHKVIPSAIDILSKVMIQTVKGEKGVN